MHADTAGASELLEDKNYLNSFAFLSAYNIEGMQSLCAQGTAVTVLRVQLSEAVRCAL